MYATDNTTLIGSIALALRLGCVLPSRPFHCRATPADIAPFFSTADSSKTNAAPRPKCPLASRINCCRMSRRRQVDSLSIWCSRASFDICSLMEAKS